MTDFANYKKYLSAGMATGAITLCMSSLGASQVGAQNAPSVLPAVSVDAPRQHARSATVRTRTAPQRTARVTPRRVEQPAPAAPVTTMGTTRTIGTPAPAYAGGQLATGGTLGLLGSTSVMNTPFSTTNYTSQLIENQQGRTAADTLINDASVRATTGANGFDDTLQIRGFQVGPEDVGLNGLYGLAAPNHVPSQIIERIELLKGPGTLINGIAPSGSVGGAVNIVTKRATEQDFARITPFFLSSANYGLHIETSRRFGDNKEWGVRFNGVGRNGEASIDSGNWRSGIGALSIDYRGDRLRWTLDAISQNDDTRNFRPQITIDPTVAVIPRPPDARSNWFPNTNLKQRDNTIASGGEYDIADWLTAFAGIGYRDGNGGQNLAGNLSGITTNGNFDNYNAYYDFYSKAVSGNVGARARFNTGIVDHAVNVVYTGYNREDGYGYNSSFANVASPASFPSNVYNPAPLPGIEAGRPALGKSGDLTLSSVAMSDTLSFLNDAVLFTLGMRHQKIKQEGFDPTSGLLTGAPYDASATTPLAGLVVKPWHNVSLYANYAEGLSPGQVVPLNGGYTNAGAILAPYKSKQQEAGVKVDWGTITTTVALFQIARPNIGTTSATLGYNGEQRNRGVELNAYGLILPGLRGMASATFLRPELTNPDNPAERGNDAAGVPDKTFSAGLDWDAPWVPGLAFNGRVIYTAGAYLTNANLVRYDDWTRLDLGARYTTTSLTGKPVTFRANIENVTGANYWLTTASLGYGTFVTVGSPRSYLLSAAFDF